MPLKIAAKIDKGDQRYFEQVIKKLLDHPLIEFVGEINESQKQEFLGNAVALLFPIDWSEPFGLVMIESLACGTPVVAYRNGSVPEIVEHGRSGFVVKDQEDAIKAVKNISSIRRTECRSCFEKRFTADRMASDYVELYQQMIGLRRRQRELKLMQL
jgi:glycosyltransferase involved in cell wall biosynthesis